MIVNFKVKTLDAQTHELSVDNEITVRELKDKIAEKTNIRAEQQRIIYCGRVLADETFLEEFDVDGKVLHVAERPPPSQGGPTTSSRANDNPPIRERTGLRGMRNSPLFRALDGMVVGSVSLPNNSAGRIVNPFASSSSFCMNRITVARHMLECANNIAAYLENPQRGLNNTSLDILQRGRWTMESTVVEVGISTADLPQGQNIVEMVQGAVTAALRGEPSNVTVVSLPTVFDHDGSMENRNDDDNSNESETHGSATVIIQSVSDSDNETTEDSPESIVTIEDDVNPIDPYLMSSNLFEEVEANRPPPDPRPRRSSRRVRDTSRNESPITSAANADTNGESNARRRTSPTVLALVIDLWRRVQNRLNPFIDQFYVLLNSEPNFEEGTTQREDAQRLFDRVSEAFHYMSHATHAISDLMLDFSLPTPRYLTCRPILVEQSGYISSNNFLTSPPLLHPSRIDGRNYLFQQRQTQTDNVRRNVNSQATNTNITGNIATASNVPTTTRYDDPGDTAPIRPNIRQVSSMNVGTQSTDTSQIPMARLIQAVVNGAPIDTEFHVQINAPIVSFGVPVNVASVHADPPSRTNDTTQQQTTNTTSDNQVRSNTATLPTISTQTRPTSRPQVQMGSFPGGNRILPTTPVVHSFDRFLPCNSHHIRDLHNPNNNNNNARSNNNSRDSNNPRGNNGPSNVSRSATNSPANFAAPIRLGNTRSFSEPRTINLPGNVNSNEVNLESVSPQVESSVQTASSRDEGDLYRNNLRSQLLDFVNVVLFRGKPINDDNMPKAVHRAVRWFKERLLFLPQYEKNEYEAMDSVTNVLRQTLPVVFNLLINPFETTSEFEQNLKKIFEKLQIRLYSVMCMCIGHINTELYWSQLMRLILVQLRKNFRDEALSFLRFYVDPKVPIEKPDKDEASKYLVLREKTESDKALIQGGKKKLDTPPEGSGDIDMTDVPSTSSSSRLSSAKKFKNPISDDTNTDNREDGGAATAEKSAERLGATSSEKTENDNKPPKVEEIPKPARRVEPLPAVEIGSEPWHGDFPVEWLPVITRDIQKANSKKTMQISPYSDAYIQGMAVKRRRALQNTKPVATPLGLLRDNLSTVLGMMQHTNSSASHTQEAIVQDIASTIAADSSVRASYMDALRTNIRRRIKTDSDYDPNKYPSIKKFMEDKK